MTCTAFGDPDLDVLAVTTTRVDLTEDQLAGEPSAGALFIYRAPQKGLPEKRFAGAVPASN